jgi:receptor protein-tyrosine kinase
MGLLVGLGAAFLFEHLDTGIKTANELGEIYGVPVLANIPEEKGRKADLARLTLKERAGTPAAEAYRMLRNNLEFVNFDKGIKAVLITSSIPGQGKSTVAANLSAVLSLAGYRVALVVCDFHRAAADQYFELEKSTGLSNVLAGTSDLWPALRPAPGFANLAVLSAGPVPPNPSELLGSAAMERVVNDLREKFDWVILDSAPVLAAADALAPARWVDGLLVVARIGNSKRDAETAGRDQLANVGARILGLAVWGPNVASPSLGYYGYNYSSVK